MRALSEKRPVELNLAPIIDCFSVLLTYLLVSASFVSLGVLDTGAIIPNGAVKAAVAPRLTVHLGGDGTIRLTWQGESDGFSSLNPTIHGWWDTSGLEARLRKAQSDNALPEMTLNADASVPYKTIIQVVEVAKKMGILVFLEG